MTTNRQAKARRRIRHRKFGTLAEGPSIRTGAGLVEWVKQFNKQHRPVVKGTPIGPRKPKHKSGDRTYEVKPHYWGSVREQPKPPMEVCDPLLARIEAVLELSGESQTRFGILTGGDAALVSRMRRGMRIKKLARRQKIEARIDMLLREHEQRKGREG